MKLVHVAALTGLILAALLPQAAEAQTLTIGTVTSANGNPFGHFVAANYPTEYQELYNPADFTGPFTIGTIGFASSPLSRSGGPASFDATISLSTTKTAYNAPSTTFAANEGQNVQTVFSGILQTTLQINGTFDLVFPTQAYTYDPSQGTLLMDIVVHQVPNLTRTPTFFETDATGADFTRVWTDSGTNTTDNFGMVTRFGPASPAAPIPEASTTVSFGLLLCLGLGGLAVKSGCRNAKNASQRHWFSEGGNYK